MRVALDGALEIDRAEKTSSEGRRGTGNEVAHQTLKIRQDNKLLPTRHKAKKKR